jgi:hypothetical protein
MWRLAPSATGGRSVHVTRNFALLVAATCGNTFKFIYDEKDSVNKICLKPNSKEFEKLLDIDFPIFVCEQLLRFYFRIYLLSWNDIYIQCRARASVCFRRPRHATCRLYTAVAMKRTRSISIKCYQRLLPYVTCILKKQLNVVSGQ